jgi:hypothetical protein
MTDTSLDELGPVDYLVVEFPAGASNFAGEMATELLALVDSGTIRVIEAGELHGRVLDPQRDDPDPDVRPPRFPLRVARKRMDAARRGSAALRRGPDAAPVAG